MKRILIVTGDGAEELEVYYPLERMREEGYEVVIASTKPKTLALKVHQVVGDEDTYSEWPGRTIDATLAVSEAKMEDFDGVIFPGGRAPEYLRRNADVLRLAQEADAAGKPIAAVCHGPMILAEAGILSAKECTAVADIIPEVERAGGSWVDERVHVEGNVVTAQTWEDCGPWMGAYVKKLADD